jgi:hypothetical protein
MTGRESSDSGIHTFAKARTVSGGIPFHFCIKNSKTLAEVITEVPYEKMIVSRNQCLNLNGLAGDLTLPFYGKDKPWSTTGEQGSGSEVS